MRWTSCLILLFVTAACSGPVSDPEQQIRDLITQAKLAAEEHRTDELKELVGEQYRDRRGWGPLQIAALIHSVLMQHRHINLFTVVQNVDVLEPSQARAEVLVAMTGRRINSAEELSGLRAKLWHFEIWFKLDGDEWRVVRADWRPAGLNEFLL